MAVGTGDLLLFGLFAVVMCLVYFLFGGDDKGEKGGNKKEAGTSSKQQAVRLPAKAAAAKKRVRARPRKDTSVAKKERSQAKEDLWAFQPIGAPFPDKPMRVRGHTNQYVALWYKHGKPVTGRAWNNGGVVECSFAYNKQELTGKRDLGGDIQILAYPAEDQWEGYPRLGYWYQWVPYTDYLKRPNSELVRCSQSTPILIKTKTGEELLGNLNLSTEVAEISYGGKGEQLAGGAQIGKDAFVLCRNLFAPPPKVDTSGRWLGPKVEEEQWLDLKVGDTFPMTAVRALGRELKQEDGSMMIQCVALWYKHGEPVMGRCWASAAGKLSALFSWEGKEFGGADIGSMQVLAYHADGRMGFDYKWLPFSQASAAYIANQPNTFQPVHVGDVCPCVIRSAAGHERLGKVSLSKEKAGSPFNGKEEVYQGPQVAHFLVLCRNPPGERK